jgi:hypothetical protein
LKSRGRGCEMLGSRFGIRSVVTQEEYVGVWLGGGW